MLTVFNVGQGDSLLLRGDKGCFFHHNPLLIDCGTQDAKVGDRLSQEGHIVLLTHSHRDHIGGFPRIYRQKKISALVLPLYFPEIIRIAHWFGNQLSRIYGKLDWRKVNKIGQIRLVSEGDRVCRHITVLNPPKDPREYFKEFSTDISIAEALETLKNYGYALPTDEIINYQTPITNIHSELDPEYSDPAREFVHLFFKSLSGRLQKPPRQGTDYYVAAHLEMTANQASVVFKYKYYHQDGDWLFTGDADQRVFNRLIKSKSDITAKYLKIPHHGSRENISERILECINPEVAIVSHGNRKFGRSKDTHPHPEVIDLLDIKGIRTYYTNDVIKNGIVIKPATSTPVENGAISFT